jgi:hypothetical protein
VNTIEIIEKHLAEHKNQKSQLEKRILLVDGAIQAIELILQELTQTPKLTEVPQDEEK